MRLSVHYENVIDLTFLGIVPILTPSMGTELNIFIILYVNNKLLKTLMTLTKRKTVSLISKASFKNTL